MNKMKCIYCLKEVTKGHFSEEHIISDSFGCEMKFRDGVCKSCNDYFGRTIEAKAHKYLENYRYIFGIKSKKGKEPEMEVKFENADKNLTGQIVRVDKNGTIKSIPCKPLGESKVKDNLKYRDFRVYDPSYTKKLHKEFLSKNPAGKWEILSETKMEVTASFDFRFEFLKDIDFLRCISKYALNYYCFNLGRELTLDSQFDEIRKFIKSENSAANSPTYPFINQKMYTILPISMPNHFMLIVGLAKQRKIVCITILFGLFYFYTVLSNSYKGIGGWSYEHEIDPINRTAKNWNLRKKSIPNIPINEIQYPNQEIINIIARFAVDRLRDEGLIINKA